MTTGRWAGRWVWPALAAVLVATWSSGFIGLRYASEHAPVLLVLFWRTLVSGLVLVPFALRGPAVSRKALLAQMAYGVGGMFLYLGGFALAIGQRVPTGLVALIADLVPLAIAVLSQPVLGQRLSGRQWAGTAVGVAGVVLVSAESLSLGSAPVWAYGLPVVAMLMFAGMTVVQKRVGAFDLPILQSLCIQCLTAAVCFAAVSGGDLAPPMEMHFVFGVAWLVGVATFVCYSLYYLCLRLYPAAQVASVVYLSPPVTMIWAAAMFGEPLTAVMFGGLGITLVGVWLAASPRVPVARVVRDERAPYARIDG